MKHDQIIEKLEHKQSKLKKELSGSYKKAKIPTTAFIYADNIGRRSWLSNLRDWFQSTSTQLFKKQLQKNA